MHAIQAKAVRVSVETACMKAGVGEKSIHCSESIHKKSPRRHKRIYSGTTIKGHKTSHGKLIVLMRIQGKQGVVTDNNNNKFVVAIKWHFIHTG